MKLYSMTATFGKLEHETLTLQPGLNIIEAPNEWGKSTWCAFLVAMLYGIVTRERTTGTALADKERYAPWSGSPMSGRIDLNWNGRDITIERRTKGRSIFGDFKAYETQSGLPIPELTAASCGEQLLGVEKNVFTRSAFLRLADLPVAQDETLRRRLNALVTTGDESGASDALAQKLKDLKNRCRSNRANGLIPQALAQKEDLERTLRQLTQHQTQAEILKSQQAACIDRIARLENHQSALLYAQDQENRRKYDDARHALQKAQLQAEQLNAACTQLPDRASLENRLEQLRQLRQERDTLHTAAQQLPPIPQAPQIPEPFRGLNAADAQRQAATDVRVFTEACREKAARLPGLGTLAVLIGSPLFLLIPHWSGIALAVIGILAGAVLLRGHFAARKRAAATAKALQEKYPGLATEDWERAAAGWAQAQLDFAAAQESLRKSLAEIHAQEQALSRRTEALTDGQPLSQCEQEWIAALATRQALADAQKEQTRAEALARALSGTFRQVPPPAAADTLDIPAGKTAQLLADAKAELDGLRLQLGQCQGQMEALGSREVLQQQLSQVSERLTRLEETYAALELAQKTLTDAANALQRRFAPQISRRAQELFSKLTGSRYDRLTLGEDLSLSAGAQGEDTTHPAIWRSDGTVDQLYLALRLAVAQALTPEAPLILDDALVRFDDTRLRAAMAILQEEAETKQVILFTCQSREKQHIHSSAEL